MDSKRGIVILWWKIVRKELYERYINYHLKMTGHSLRHRRRKYEVHFWDERSSSCTHALVDGNWRIRSSIKYSRLSLANLLYSAMISFQEKWNYKYNAVWKPLRMKRENESSVKRYVLFQKVRQEEAIILLKAWTWGEKGK